MTGIVALYIFMLAAFTGYQNYLDEIAQAEVVVDQWQLEKLGLVTEKLSVLYYVPGLPEQYQKQLWGKSYSSPESAIAGLTGSLSPGARVAVIPEGPYVLGRVAQQVAAD